MTVPAFRYIPPDRYICSFHFGSPGRLATKDKRERTDGRIWVGRIEARLIAFDERGARRYAAGDFDEASALFIRVKRQVAAGLILDAEDDMDRLEPILTRVETRLRSARR